MNLLTLLLFSLVLILGNSTKVSLQNLEAFFNSTLDSFDHDGQATLAEFVNYFQFMEPQHNLTEKDIKPTFELYDINGDLKVTIKQLVDFAQIQVQPKYKPGHKQIHLGITGKDNQMQVIWVSNPESYETPVVYYGLYPTKLNLMVRANSTTYNVGHVGFHGRIYTAVMNNLIPLKRYYYKVGDLKTNTFSQTKFFKASPLKGTVLPEINMAVTGDVGTFAPFGNLIMKQISRDNFAKGFDFMFLTGDIAYAGMNSAKVGEFQPIWDLFGELSESFAAYIPFMPGVGNHEKYYNYTSYHSRYRLPRKYENQTNQFFSFDYGQLHIAYLSSQHPYQKGSEQYTFLQQDLKEARSNPNTQWIIVGAHRSFYYSDACQHRDITPLVLELEDLLYQYKVDIVQTGHLHAYERTWPIYKNKATKIQENQNIITSPTAPIYVVQGAGGALINEKWIDPIPEWSIKRMLKYGYGRVNIRGSTLKYQYVDAWSGKILDEWYIKK